MSDEQQQEQGPPPRNVRLAQNATPVAVEGEVNFGGHGAVALPSEEEQRAGFYLEPESLTLLVTQYPGIYKPVQAIRAVPVPVVKKAQEPPVDGEAQASDTQPKDVEESPKTGEEAHN